MLPQPMRRHKRSEVPGRCQSDPRGTGARSRCPRQSQLESSGSVLRVSPCQLIGIEEDSNSRRAQEYPTCPIHAAVELAVAATGVDRGSRIVTVVPRPGTELTWQLPPSL